MPLSLSGFILLDDEPSRSLSFRTTRSVHGSIDIEVAYRHTGQHEAIHVTPGSELYLCITRLLAGLQAEPHEAAAPRIVAIG